MPSKIEAQSFVKKAELKQSDTYENIYGVLSEPSDSELRWVKLHQMFDRWNIEIFLLSVEGSRKAKL